MKCLCVHARSLNLGIMICSISGSLSLESKGVPSEQVISYLLIPNEMLAVFSSFLASARWLTA